MKEIKVARVTSRRSGIGTAAVRIRLYTIMEGQF
jgi:hypothetical protein